MSAQDSNPGQISISAFTERFNKRPAAQLAEIVAIIKKPKKRLRK
ncbi:MULTISPECIES: hypothetical protein [Trichocoleus]|nr:hypothetical protein [Trichocoleus sp. FACHB-46]